MSDGKGEQQGSVWPLPKFHFLVHLGDDMDVEFLEVSGLSETPVIEYRHGDSPVFYPIKMPGLGKVSNVTMRKGIFANDQKFWQWFSGIKMNTIARRTVVINLLDETGAPKMVWTLHNAWPIKITGADLKSEDNEVAVETLELAFETLEVKAG
jgi:phage tail-like protein